MVIAIAFYFYSVRNDYGNKTNDNNNQRKRERETERGREEREEGRETTVNIATLYAQRN